jgi:broad specificity phosphatase PhoE
MKYVYFVRHGETEVNVKQLNHSYPGDELTERGKEQAEFIAARCSKLPLQVLVTSTYTRAKQTANYIAQKTGLNPEESDLFTEVHFISKYWNKVRTLESEAALKSIHDNWGVPDYRVGDEENYEDIIARATKALNFLIQKPEEHIGVVTHGQFMRNLVAQALFGESITPHIQNAFARGFHVENTSLTILRYAPETEVVWRVMTWNDRAHLAD